MALLDILRVTARFECPTSVASFSLVYRETVASATDVRSPLLLAQAWSVHAAVELKAMMSTDYQYISCFAELLFDDPLPSFRDDANAGPGIRVAPGLPASNCVIINITQSQFTPRHNGRIFIPGIAEGDTLVGNLTTAYVNGPVAAMHEKLAQQVVALSGNTARWDVGVINRTVLNAAPPAKDWAGAFAPATFVGTTPIIAIQRRRATGAIGISA